MWLEHENCISSVSLCRCYRFYLFVSFTHKPMELACFPWSMKYRSMCMRVRQTRDGSFFSFINVCVSANTTNDAAADDDDDRITTQATVPKSQYRQ